MFQTESWLITLRVTERQREREKGREREGVYFYGVYVSPFWG